MDHRMAITSEQYLAIEFARQCQKTTVPRVWQAHRCKTTASLPHCCQRACNTRDRAPMIIFIVFYIERRSIDIEHTHGEH